MANTYTQIHFQVVFAVRNRQSLICKEWSKELYMYISGIIRNNRHKPLAINGTADHIHILFGMKPSQSLSDLMQDIKGSSSRWIDERNLTAQRFSWQEGYGAFTYSESQLPRIIRYIENQEEHHRKKQFVEEYRNLLDESKIEYNSKYIFEPVGLNEGGV